MARKQSDASARFNALNVEESKLAAGSQDLHAATQAAEGAVSDAERARVAAEVGSLRGGADVRERAAQREREAREELRAAQIREQASGEAIIAVRRERQQLVETHRAELLGLALDSDARLRQVAAECVKAIGQLIDASRDAAAAYDRLQPRDHQYGYVVGEPARLRFNALEVSQMLAATVERGLVPPPGLDREGAPISIAQRAEAEGWA